jgi:hypothetical protein
LIKVCVKLAAMMCPNNITTVSFVTIVVNRYDSRYFPLVTPLLSVPEKLSAEIAMIYTPA